MQDTYENTSDTEKKQEATPAESEEIDKRSIFIGNVDYSASTEELREIFKECGNIERVTIPIDKFSMQPKGYAYIEFSEATSVFKAQSLNDKAFKSRKLKVLPKRTNVPGMKKRSVPQQFRRGYGFSRPKSKRYRAY
jgi:polyadenylate-binding protein 2